MLDAPYANWGFSVGFLSVTGSLSRVMLSV